MMTLAQSLLKLQDEPSVVDNAVSLYLTLVIYGPNNSVPVPQVLTPVAVALF